ncbi:unnamed protein product, partial [Pylaiella littoralis]
AEKSAGQKERPMLQGGGVKTAVVGQKSRSEWCCCKYCCAGQGRRSNASVRWYESREAMTAWEKSKREQADLVTRHVLFETDCVNHTPIYSLRPSFFFTLRFS